MKKFNDWLAVKITSGVATMWCAYAFAGIAIYGGFGVNWKDQFQAVAWLSQTFLQLVLLSIIMVGQKVLSDASDKQAKEMHDTVMESHKELKHLVKEIHTSISEFHKDAKQRFEMMHPEMAEKIESVSDQSQL